MDDNRQVGTDVRMDRSFEDRLWHLRRPDRAVVERFLASQREQPVTYADVGATRETLPSGWPADRHRASLGMGAARFVAARAALARWKMFPAPLASVEPCDPPAVGEVAVVVMRALGLWWLNAMRVVYVTDEPRRYAFACGTLPGHVACGEERFTVEHTDDDRVSYEVTAFSRPRMLAARVASPLTRSLRARFVRDSLAAVARAVDAPGIVAP